MQRAVSVVRRLLNLAACTSLLVCAFTIIVRLTTTPLSQTGVTFSVPGRRFVVLSGDGKNGQIVVYREWPTSERLHVFLSEPHIGPSGQGGSMNSWWNQRFGLFYEWGDSYVYVDVDGRTPLMGNTAGKLLYPSVSPTRFWTLIFPLNLLVAAMATLPFGAGLAALLRYLYRAQARQAHAANRCVRCGYDLRGTPDRCPECGAVVAAKPQAAA